MTNIFGIHDQNTLDQFREVGNTAVRTALMADGHFGYIMPVGGVAAYRNQVSVHGVGYDIACGNKAVKLDVKASDLTQHDIDRIADEIQATISFGVGRSNRAKDAPTDHMLFDDLAWESLTPYMGKQAMLSLKSKARDQLGTVGSGNHYVDVFKDEADNVWVGVHFGSRGLGHTIASGFMNLAHGQAWDNRKGVEQPTILDLDTSLGMHYWNAMTLAGEYAYAGRDWVCRVVADLIGGKIVDQVHNHHNYAWKEQHFGEELVVVRKGATPAFPGQRGFVGGSMGDDAVILEGTRSVATWPDEPSNVELVQRDALYSTVHGAGRVMSRTEAAGKRDRKTGQLKLDSNGQPVKPPRVDQNEVNTWLKDKGVTLRGGGLDEAPQAYRRLPDVLKAQGDTVTVLHTLTPLIVVMAGANEFDPYKD